MMDKSEKDLRALAELTEDGFASLDDRLDILEKRALSDRSRINKEK